MLNPLVMLNGFHPFRTLNYSSITKQMEPIKNKSLDLNTSLCNAAKLQSSC